MMLLFMIASAHAAAMPRDATLRAGIDAALDTLEEELSLERGLLSDRLSNDLERRDDAQFIALVGKLIPNMQRISLKGMTMGYKPFREGSVWCSRSRQLTRQRIATRRRCACLTSWCHRPGT